MRGWRSAGLLALALVSGPALAEDASGCAAFKWSVARERSAFATPGLEAIDQGKPLPGIMDPVVATLKPVGDVTFSKPPGRKPAGDTFGGVFKLPPLAVGGNYQLTLSDDAWIDVLQGGREVRSSAASTVTSCPGIRKSVRFPLATGDATVQISGAKANSVKIDFLPVE